jgi:hypothetical protein
MLCTHIYAHIYMLCTHAHIYTQIYICDSLPTAYVLNTLLSAACQPQAVAQQVCIYMCTHTYKVYIYLICKLSLSIKECMRIAQLLYVCRRTLTHADVCWRMLTYADAC